MSRDGRYVAFYSTSSRLVPDDNNQQADIFRRDLRTGTTERVSVNVDGGDADGNSSYPMSMSGDGRYVAFHSWAPDLVPDRSANGGVYVRDMTAHTTIQVAANSYGDLNIQHHQPAISANGRYVAFARSTVDQVGSAPDVVDLYRYDMQTQVTELVSVDAHGGPADGFSGGSLSLSGDGNLVAFISRATDLVDPADSNGFYDVYVRNMQAATTALVTVDVAGGSTNAPTQNAMISASGQFVAFFSPASDLVTGDDNDLTDLFVRDLGTGTTERTASNAEGATNSLGMPPSISDDGRFVAFNSTTPNLIPGGNPPGTFVYDRSNDAIAHVSSNVLGFDVDPAIESSLSGDGRYIAFRSFEKLVKGDTTGTEDVFVRATFLPRIDNVIPATIPMGQAQAISITGDYFPADAEVHAYTESNGFDVKFVGVINAVSPTSIEATITIPAGVPGEPVHVGVFAPPPGPGVIEGSLGVCTSCPILG